MTIMKLRPEQKAAALVVALGPGAASGLLQYLSEKEVEQLAMEVAKIGRVQPETMDQVFIEVQQGTTEVRADVAGGVDYARELLTEWKGRQGAEIIERLLADLNVEPFSFVRAIDPEQLHRILRDEHPQTVALILAHQPPSYAATLLRDFEPDIQADVAFRVATMGKAAPEVIGRVETALRTRLGSVSSADVTVRGGIEDLAEVLNNTDRTTEKAILERLAGMDAELTEQVRALMFVFEDIATLDDRSVQLVLQGVDSKTLALAMKGVSPDVSEVMLRNMSQRAAESLNEEIELLGPVRRPDVEAAQTGIVKVVRQLEDAGDIILSRAGESDLIE